jgi:hypothetical protein
LIISVPNENGTVDAGSIIAVSGTGGNQIGSTIFGTATGDMQQATITESPNSDFYLLSLPLAYNNASVDSGFVQLIVQ